MLKIKDINNPAVQEKLVSMGFEKKTHLYNPIFIKTIHMNEDMYYDGASGLKIDILINQLMHGDGRIAVYVNNYGDIDCQEDDIDLVNRPNELDILYDLIMEGMVEKCKEEEND